MQSANRKIKRLTTKDTNRVNIKMQNEKLNSKVQILDEDRW